MTEVPKEYFNYIILLVYHSSYTMLMFQLVYSLIVLQFFQLIQCHEIDLNKIY